MPTKKQRYAKRALARSIRNNDNLSKTTAQQRRTARRKEARSQ